MFIISQAFGQTFNVVHNFTNTPDGKFPEAGLLLSGNTLYGTTFNGGAFSNGVVFTLNTDGSGFAVIHDFSALVHSTNFDGANPQSSLILINDMLYGTSRNGGYVVGVSITTGNGTVFALNTNGTGFAVVNYIPPDEPYPQAGLVFDGNTLYGTTFGISGGSPFGMVFKVNTNGMGFTNLNSFGGKHSQASLTLGSNTLYGTTFGGGGTDYGSVFAINIDGTGFTNLIEFNYQSSNGGQPEADLVLNGNTLYGTSAGGSSGGTVFKINTDGTGFVTLKSFINNVNAIDGSAPVAGLVLSGSTLYGTTKWGGSGGKGTVFRINTDGTGYTVLENFGGSSGINPLSDLVLGGNVLYGTTQLGGSSGFGVVFSLTLPLPSLQVITDPNGPIVFWIDDGMNHTLQTTTDLITGSWTNIPNLNWTNNSSGALKIGCQIANSSSSQTAFFRIQ